MTCIVVDDEALARDGLVQYIEKIDFLTLAASYGSLLECAEQLQNGTIDLLFLDIQMPHLTGIDFLKAAQKLPLVIIHTAYPIYALQGYELDVIDYLVKPVSFGRFFKSVSKAHSFHALHQQQSGPSTQLLSEKDYFFVKCDKVYEKIVYHEILYIEALQNYSMIYTARQKFMTLMSLKTLEEALPGSMFVRAHKSFIINTAQVNAIADNDARIGQKLIPLRPEAKQLLLEKLL